MFPLSEPVNFNGTRPKADTGEFLRARSKKPAREGWNKMRRGAFSSVEENSQMKTILAVTATVLIFAMPSLAVAKSGKVKHAGGYHGASYYAPGHVKKRLGLQSARSVAPGHIKKRWW